MSTPHVGRARHTASAPLRSRWAAVSAAIVAGLVAFAILFDWNWLRHPLEAYIGRKTHRALTIADLHVHLGWVPTVRLRDVTFANAAWAGPGPMAKIGSVEFSISSADLFRGNVVIPHASLTDAELHFERLPDGRRNWTLAAPDDTSPSRVRIGSATLSHATLDYADRGLALVVHAVANDVGAATRGRYTTRYRFDGRYRDASFTGQALTGSASDITNAAATFPVRGRLVAGTTTLDIDGSITDAARTGAVDAQLRIEGSTLANLYPFLRLPLPASPAYRISGHLTHRDSRFELSDIRGVIGSTDIAGTATYFDREPRPLLQARLHSDLLDAADLGPLVGVTTKAATSVAAPTQAQTNTRESAKAQEQQATGDRILPAGLPAGEGLLPTGAFEGGRLHAMDAEAELTATRVVAPDRLAAGNVHATVRLDDAVVKLDPLELDFAGGRVISAIDVDARRPTLAARMTVRFSQLKLAQLLPQSSLVVQSQGLLDGQLALSGTGNSVADAAANADGHIDAVLSHAQISNLVDAAAGLNGGKVLKLLLGGDKDIPVRCGAAAFDVHDGQGRTSVFVVDTKQTRIDGGGGFDFERERFDLIVMPQPKHASILSLRTPVRLRGTFRHPGYELDKTRLALRAGSAIALGLVAPAAAFLPLIETGPGKDVDCEALADAVLATSTPPPA